MKYYKYYKMVDNRLTNKQSHFTNIKSNKFERTEISYLRYYLQWGNIINKNIPDVGDHSKMVIFICHWHKCYPALINYLIAYSFSYYCSIKVTAFIADVTFFLLKYV